jgi:hypothetical protein
MDFTNHTYFLIGIDDTDNADSRGTGYHSRQLAHQLEQDGMAVVNGITRHQLFVSPEIRYTSQNSSACIGINTDNIQLITEICERYLIENSAPGSDAALCIAPGDDVDKTVKNWGDKAKYIVLHMDEANALAKDTGIYLKGFTGTHEGIIGAMAAVGLRATGNDGRFIWRRSKKELREIKAGIIGSNQLINELELGSIEDLNGSMPQASDKVYLHDWVRPVLKNNKAVLIVEKTKDHESYEWKLASKEIVRTIS